MEIIITALTTKGKEVLSTQGDQSKAGKMALKMLGVSEEVIKEEPYTIRVNLKRCPGPVFEQMELSLISKFEQLGAIKGIDFNLEVKR